MNYFLPNDARSGHHATGVGTGTHYHFSPVYGKAPFPALNSDAPTPPIIDWATEAGLVYNAGDGTLTLDTAGDNGGDIFLYSLRFTEPVVQTEAFRSVTGNEFVQVGPSEIIEVGHTFGAIPAGVYDLGSVLPAGLSESAFLELVNRARFVGEPGHTASSLDVSVSGIE